MPEDVPEDVKEATNKPTGFAKGPRLGVFLDKGDNHTNIKYNQVPAEALEVVAPTIEHAILSWDLLPKSAVAVSAFDALSLKEICA